MCVILGAILDIVHYYWLEGSNSGLYGKIAFLGFIVILGIESGRRTIRNVQKGYRTRELEKFAFGDAMTGLYNRNAYNYFVAGEHAFYNHMIVTFDLNDLKECNDNFGHSAGDLYLKCAAGIIEKVFGQYGKCYRIGGDEFCCVIENAAACPVEEAILLMRQEISMFNSRKRLPIHMDIACGYAVFGLGDDDVEMVRVRADEMMYRNKKELKEECRK